MPPATFALTPAEHRRTIQIPKICRWPRDGAAENLLFALLGFVVTAIPGALFLLIRGLP